MKELTIRLWAGFLGLEALLLIVVCLVTVPLLFLLGIPPTGLLHWAEDLVLRVEAMIEAFEALDAENNF